MGRTGSMTSALALREQGLFSRRRQQPRRLSLARLPPGLSERLNGEQDGMVALLIELQNHLRERRHDQWEAGDTQRFVDIVGRIDDVIQTPPPPGNSGDDDANNPPPSRERQFVELGGASMLAQVLPIPVVPPSAAVAQGGDGGAQGQSRLSEPVAVAITKCLQVLTDVRRYAAPPRGHPWQAVPASPHHSLDGAGVHGGAEAHAFPLVLARLHGLAVRLHAPPGIAGVVRAWGRQGKGGGRGPLHAHAAQLPFSPGDADSRRACETHPRSLGLLLAAGDELFPLTAVDGMEDLVQGLSPKGLALFCRALAGIFSRNDELVGSAPPPRALPLMRTAARSCAPVCPSHPGVCLALGLTALLCARTCVPAYIGARRHPRMGSHRWNAPHRTSARSASTARCCSTSPVSYPGSRACSSSNPRHRGSARCPRQSSTPPRPVRAAPELPPHAPHRVAHARARAHVSPACVRERGR
jgi:hypothetical protein